MSLQDNVTIVRELFAGFDSHDLDRAVAVVSADFELVDVARGQTFRGPDGCRQWLQMGLTAAPDAKTEITNIVGAGEWVFSEHTGRGTNTGPLSSPGRDSPDGALVRGADRRGVPPEGRQD